MMLAVRRPGHRGFIESSLLGDEQLVERARLHWVVFVAPIGLVLLGLALALTGVAHAMVGGVVLLLGVGCTADAAFSFATSEFGITNRRLLVKTGFTRRNARGIQLPSLDSIEVDQGLLGRILGFGSIVVTGAGGWRDPFHRIAAPAHFRRRLEELKRS